MADHPIVLLSHTRYHTLIFYHDLHYIYGFSYLMLASNAASQVAQKVELPSQFEQCGCELNLTCSAAAACFFVSKSLSPLTFSILRNASRS